MSYQPPTTIKHGKLTGTAAADKLKYSSSSNIS